MAAAEEITDDTLQVQYRAGQHAEILEICERELGVQGCGKERKVMFLWRAARSCFELADRMPATDKTGKEAMLRRGLAHAEECIATDSDSWQAYKWWAILRSGLGDYVSTKEKILAAVEIKEHALKVLELQPDDASTQHLLGRWCYSVANVSWFERKAASLLFATPPESSFEEALIYFDRADELCPPPLRPVRNTYYKGEAHYNLKQWEEAKAAFQRCLDFQKEGLSETELDYIEKARAKISKC